jgi:hypothetical protein
MQVAMTQDTKIGGTCSKAPFHTSKNAITVESGAEHIATQHAAVQQGTVIVVAGSHATTTTTSIFPPAPKIHPMHAPMDAIGVITPPGHPPKPTHINIAANLIDATVP